MSLENVNIVAWELAIEYVEWNEEKKGLQSISNRMLQKIFSAFGEKEPQAKIKIIRKIEEIVKNYSPPEGEKKKKKVEEFCKKLLKELEKISLEDGKMLVTYLMWNVKALEALEGKDTSEKKLESSLEAEGVPEDKIRELSQKVKTKLGS